MISDPILKNSCIGWICRNGCAYFSHTWNW